MTSPVVRSRRPRIRPARVVNTVLALIVSLAWAFPVYWMLNSSLLPNAVLTSTTPRFFPWGGSLDNFAARIMKARENAVSSK